jgi:anti-sigma regulatory factor (Ser/Thr protein kinase)
MSPRRAICVSRDGGACALVERALSTAGLAVDHARELPADTAGAVLVVADAAARRAAGEALRAQPVPVIVVGDDLDDDALIALMDEAPVSHLVEDPGDRTLEVASEKLATGDVWGLEKYLAPGAAVRERVVRGELDKRRAMDEVSAWAEANGARRGAVHRIANVVDELLMNALIAGEAAGGAEGRRAVLRWASDPRTLAVSVLDGGGALRQRDLIDHVRRARLERGRPQSPLDGDEAGGAGLGLYLVLANVAGLVVNVAPGRRTEVVCLFDRPAADRPPISRTRSLHVFAGA